MNKEKYQEIVKERQKINMIILEELMKEVLNNPNLRLGQILVNRILSKYDSLDQHNIKQILFNEEPSVTWSKFYES